MQPVGFWIRLLAFWIDGVIIGIPLSIVVGGFYLLLLLVISLGSRASNTMQVFYSIALFAVYILIWLISVVGQYLYFFLMTKKYGATLGKKLFKLQVVRIDGKPLDTNTVLLREVVGRLVNGLTFSIGYVIAGFTKQKQGLHDLIAKTIVIRTK